MNVKVNNLEIFMEKEYPNSMLELISKSAQETQKVAALLAASITAPFVVALEGELGSGKTTFVQGLARSLGVKAKIQSPTFVLMKVYNIIGSRTSYNVGSRASRAFKRLIHIDCYRLDSSKDLLRLGFRNLLKDKDALILIEWADRIRNLIPRSALWIKFQHGKKSYERILKFKIDN